MRVVPTFITRVCESDVARLISPAVLVCDKFSAQRQVCGRHQTNKCRSSPSVGTARPVRVQTPVARKRKQRCTHRSLVVGRIGAGSCSNARRLNQVRPSSRQPARDFYLHVIQVSRRRIRMIRKNRMVYINTPRPFRISMPNTIGGCVIFERRW